MLMLIPMLIGCNSTTSKSRNRAEKVINSLVVGTDIDIYLNHSAFECDSASLLHISYSYKDLNGKEHTKRIEYGYVIFEDETREFMKDLSSDKSTFDFMNESYEIMRQNGYTKSFEEWGKTVMRKASIHEGRIIMD